MMSTIHCHEIAAYRCTHCERSVLFARRLVLLDHRFHALLSVLTAGLWLIGWLVCCRRSAERLWECQECGCRRDRLGDSPPPRDPQASRGRFWSTAEFHDVGLPVVHEVDL